MSEIMLDKSGYGGYDSIALVRFRMKDIYEVLTQKRREATQLQREIEALELAGRLLQGDKPTANQQEGSTPQKVTAILQAEGKPLHVSQIATELKNKFKTSVKKNNLSVLLYRYAQRGSRFYKVKDKPNTYGLIEWQAKVVSMA